MLGILTTIVVLIGVWFGIKIVTSFLFMAMVGIIISLTVTTILIFAMIWAICKWDNGEK